ncbi:MAG: hypothetical protein KH420_04290 [Clostridiales bacterium]|nr:hypothetical protein [Clostridiales bacterium]
MRIGIPRAMLYYRDGALWQTFFEALGHEVVLSRPTDRQILELGIRYAIDEACLACKVYLGHVASLLDRCDSLFVPRVANFGEEGIFCTKFEALPDMTQNSFRAERLRVLSCEIDEKRKLGEQQAFLRLGRRLGASARQSREAYHAGVLARRAQQAHQLDEQRQALQRPGLKILLVGHSYLVYDAYVGEPVRRILEHMHITPLYACAAEQTASRALGQRMSPTVPWTVSRELLGAVVGLKDQVDGIILMSAFPCGPDSMVNELLTRKLHDRPILVLTMDAQDGSAGLETRLESFVDILQFRQEAACHG